MDSREQLLEDFNKQSINLKADAESVNLVEFQKVFSPQFVRDNQLLNNRQLMAGGGS